MAVTPLRAFGFDLHSPAQFLQLLLLGLVFSSALLTGHWGIGNSRIVMYHELVYIVVFCVAFPWYERLVRLVLENRGVSLLLCFWVVAVSLSFFLSPLELKSLTVARFRYAETLTHLVFGIAVLILVLGERFPLRKILVVLVLSNCLVVLQAILVWHFSSDPAIHTQRMWMYHFPMSGHARHAGYNMFVAVLAAMGLLLGSRALKSAVLSVVALLLLASCLFWLGGRAAVLSVLVGAIISVWMLRPKVSQAKVGLLVVLLAASVFIAEKASQFPFNGLSSSVSRSVNAEDLNGLSSSRIAIWEQSLEQMQGHWLLGFGSQAYLFLPDKVAPKTSSPHNFLVQFLLEWGLLGTLVICFVLAILAYKARCLLAVKRERLASPQAWYLTAVVAIVVGLVFHALLDGTLYHGKPSFYFVLFAALCFSGAAGKVNGVVTGIGRG